MEKIMNEKMNYSGDYYMESSRGYKNAFENEGEPGMIDNLPQQNNPCIELSKFAYTLLEIRKLLQTCIKYDISLTTPLKMVSMVNREEYFYLPACSIVITGDLIILQSTYGGTLFHSSNPNPDIAISNIYLALVEILSEYKK